MSIPDNISLTFFYWSAIMSFSFIKIVVRLFLVFVFVSFLNIANSKILSDTFENVLTERTNITQTESTKEKLLDNVLTETKDEITKLPAFCINDEVITYTEFGVWSLHEYKNNKTIQAKCDIFSDEEFEKIELNPNSPDIKMNGPVQYIVTGNKIWIFSPNKIINPDQKITFEEDKSPSFCNNNKIVAQTNNGFAILIHSEEKGSSIISCKGENGSIIPDVQYDASKGSIILIGASGQKVKITRATKPYSKNVWVDAKRAKP